MLKWRVASSRESSANRVQRGRATGRSSGAERLGGATGRSCGADAPKRTKENGRDEREPGRPKASVCLRAVSPELASGRAWPTRVVRATSSEGRAAPQRRQPVAGPSTGSGTGKGPPCDRLRDRKGGSQALRQAQGGSTQAHQPGDPSMSSGAGMALRQAQGSGKGLQTFGGLRGREKAQTISGRDKKQ